MGGKFANIYKKVTDYVLNISLVLTILAMGLFAYWKLYPYEIIEWRIDEFKTTKDVYLVGETLTYRTSFCKNGNYVATQIRRLEDGVVYLYPDFQTSTKEGCYDFITSTTVVPNVPSGEYTFELEFIYSPNPIREVRYTMRSNSFKILNNN